MCRYLSFLILLSITTPAAAQTFVGPGPDPACGGTELRVVQSGDRVIFMEHTILQSFRTVVEQYRSRKNGDWKITLLFYSSRWQRDEPLNKDRLIEKFSFTASDPRKATRREKDLGYQNMDWRGEPKRLLEYFRANSRDFQKQI